MSSLIFNNTKNRLFKKDATGAFIPEAWNLNRYLIEYKVNTYSEVYGLNNKSKDILGSLFSYMADRAKYKRNIFFFCHGYKDGIEYFREHPARLSEKIALYSPQIERVIFYCCNVAGGDWARLFFEELNCRVQQDVTVFGHTNSGHTTYNPNIVIYKSWQEPITKKDLIKKHGSLKKLQAALKTDYRFSLPLEV